MASHFLQLNDRISQGEGAPADGDALCTSTSIFPIGAIYIDNNTGILYARNTANGNAADWVSQSGGGGIDDVLAEAQALTAARVVDLNGNTFQVKSGGNDFLSIDPTAGSEVSYLRAYNTTDDDNSAIYLAETTDEQATFSIGALFNSNVNIASIEGQSNVTEATLAYSADTHTFTGQAIFNDVQEFADNAAAITGGLATGAIYRTGDVLKIVH